MSCSFARPFLTDLLLQTQSELFSANIDSDCISAGHQPTTDAEHLTAKRMFCSLVMLDLDAATWLNNQL